MRQLAQKSCSWPWLKLTSNEKHFGDITNPRPTRSGIFLRCMKLAIYRFGVVLFIAVLLPRAMPGGQHEMKRALSVSEYSALRGGDFQGIRVYRSDEDWEAAQMVPGHRFLARLVLHGSAESQRYGSRRW